MDGHFVPALSMGPPVVSALAGQVHDAGGYLDVHLMVERPERHIAAFAEAGADGITLHVEATPHTHYALARGARRRLPRRARALPRHAGRRRSPSRWSTRSTSSYA